MAEYEIDTMAYVGSTIGNAYFPGSLLMSFGKP